MAEDTLQMILATSFTVSITVEPFVESSEHLGTCAVLTRYVVEGYISIKDLHFQRIIFAWS